MPSISPAKLSSKLLQMLPASGGTVAFIYCVDNKLITETVEHHINLEFDAIVLIGNQQYTEFEHDRVINVSHPILEYADVWAHLQPAIASLSGHWCYWGYNAEFFYFPFCETRTVKDLAIFLTEERRNTLFGLGIDLYPRQLEAQDVEYDLSNSGLDAINYYTQPIDPSNYPVVLELDPARHFSIHGGLRWRYEEWFTDKSARIDRVPFFLVKPTLEFDKNGKTDDPEFSSYRCDHHHNPTGAVLSFRAAIDLLHNPSSRQKIQTFEWTGTETFAWNSPQLLRLGFIETGQWF